MASAQDSDRSGDCLVTLKISYSNPPGSTGERFETRKLTLAGPNHTVSVGRSSKRPGSRGPPTRNNAIFDSPVVSRDHAQLFLDPVKNLFIKDLGSLHGTFVNGRRLEPQMPTLLCSDDRVTIGSSITSAHGEPYAAVAFTLQIDYVSALSDTTNFKLLTASELELEDSPADVLEAATSGNAGSTFELAGWKADVSNNDFESTVDPGKQDNGSQFQAGASPRRPSTAFSVPSESSFDSDDDDADELEDDKLWPEDIPDAAAAVKTSQDYISISPADDHELDSQDYCPASPIVPPLPSSSGPEHASSAYHLSSDDDDADWDVDTQTLLQVADAVHAAYYATNSPKPVQNDDSFGANLDVNPAETVISHISPIQSRNTDPGMASLAIDTKVLPLSACTDVDSLFEDGGDRKDSLDQDGAGVDQNALPEAETIMPHLNPLVADEGDDLTAVRQRVLDSINVGLDRTKPIPDSLDDSQDLPISDSDFPESRKRKATVLDVANTSTSPPVDIVHMHGTCIVGSNQQVEIAEGDAAFDIVEAELEPARKRVRFEPQPTAIRSHKRRIWREAAATRKGRGYLPTAISFTLGTLVGGIAMVGGLLALPESFFS